MIFWIEILIILVIITFAWSGFRRGFLNQFFDLVGLLVSFILALKYASFGAQLLQTWGVSQTYAMPVGFFVLWLVGEIIFYLLGAIIFHYIPKSIHESKINSWLGTIPGAVKGVITVAIILMVFVSLPFAPSWKDGFVKSPIAGSLINSTTDIAKQMEAILGNLQSSSLFTKLSDSEETTKLNFQTSTYTIDVASEEIMLAEINQSRLQNGLKLLKLDSAIRTVARAHSIDMAQKGYFAHTDLDGKTPADRLIEGGVDYKFAGENIALAPTAEMAETGFMNSPKHRDNILDPNFGRVGIGIIDTGLYGKMVTQNFAD